MIDFPFPANAINLSVKEVAHFLRVDPKTVRRWIRKGHLPATRIGRDWRIARNDLKALLTAPGQPGPI